METIPATTEPLTTEPPRVTLTSRSSELESVRCILDATAYFYATTVDDMLGYRKQEHLVMPRFVACWLLKRVMGFTLAKVAWYVKKRPSATKYSIDRVDVMMADDDDVKSDVLYLRDACEKAIDEFKAAAREERGEP